MLKNSDILESSMKAVALVVGLVAAFWAGYGQENTVALRAKLLAIAKVSIDYTVPSPGTP
jgi:hypothetical protein